MNKKMIQTEEVYRIIMAVERFSVTWYYYSTRCVRNQANLDYGGSSQGNLDFFRLGIVLEFKQSSSDYLDKVPKSFHLIQRIHI